MVLTGLQKANMFSQFTGLEKDSSRDFNPSGSLSPFSLFTFSPANPDVIPKTPIFPDFTAIPLDTAAFGYVANTDILEAKHLIPKNEFDFWTLQKIQRHVQRDPSNSNLLQVDISKQKTIVKMQRLPNGEVDIFQTKEEATLNSTLTATNSTSYQRDPTSVNDFVRGKNTSMPFFPGGLDEILDKDKLKVVDLDEELDDLLKFSEGYLKSVPPGFDRGLNLSGLQLESEQTTNAIHDYMDVNVVLNAEDIELELHQTIESEKENTSNTAELQSQTQSKNSEKNEAIDNLLPDSSTFSLPKPPTKVSLSINREYAHEIDVNQPFPEFYAKVPQLAHYFPFELDTFQKHAVYHLEQNNSVFVAAHTSAGKTVVAEYAIALSQKHMTKCIYTSPIKALSNQKFRDFGRVFGEENVGILTGDVQIRPEASCLIMTTEILRSMLYRGADLVRDVEFVVFDEVHYVNDAERGVVWEEVIIMLPPHVSLILLSATVPNTKEFADWVGRTKKTDIYVISTLKRPVPLEHYLYMDKEIYKIVDSDRRFLSTGFKNATDASNSARKEAEKKLNAARGRGTTAARGFAGRGRASGGRGGAGGTFSHSTGSNAMMATDRNLYVHLIGALKKRNLLPAIIFTFSKKKCEEYAAALSNVDLTGGASEKSEIHVFIEKSISRLKGDDKTLPQVLRMRDLLYRGIGVHHGGLLPILKEIVEILFTRGLLKILFATETFAMGVNAPARCVVFSSIRKHDGSQFRDLLPGEYTQMSGRAGRRGLDSTGVVLIVCKDDRDGIPEQATMKNMILGKGMKLESRFRLTYNMILNLLRVEMLKVEEMIKRSFGENTSQKNVPEQMKKLEENNKFLSAIPKLSCTICTDIYEYYDACFKILQIGYELTEKILLNPVGMKTLTCGRILVVNNSFYRNSVALFLKHGSISDSHDKKSATIFILTDKKQSQTEPDSLPITSVDIPKKEDQLCSVVSIRTTDITLITKQFLKIDGDGILRKEEDIINSTANKFHRFVEDMLQNDQFEEFDWGKIKQVDFQERNSEKQRLVKMLPKFQCTSCPELNAHYSLIHREISLKRQVTELSHTISDQNLELLPDYRSRVEVLKRLNFVDEAGTVTLKGRVGCEINTADELILTELILDNVLGNYEPAEIVALLSCFTFQEKSQVEPVLTVNLEKGVNTIKEIAVRVADIQRECGVDTNADEVLSSLKFGLVEVVYEWARGMPFKKITELTDVLEGSIVRTIVRLDETCRDVRNGARIIGDASLYKKMEEASESIKRDIVFAASLYHG